MSVGGLGHGRAGWVFYLTLLTARGVHCAAGSMDSVSAHHLYPPADPSDGEGFLVVYSIASRSTFDRVEKIVERVLLVKDEAASSAEAYGRQAKPSGRVTTPIVIVGNKRDMIGDRVVSLEEGRALASRLGCEFFETSARLNQNVEQAFKALVRQIKIAKDGPDATQHPTSQQGTPRKRRNNKKCVIL